MNMTKFIRRFKNLLRKRSKGVSFYKGGYKVSGKVKKLKVLAELLKMNGVYWRLGRDYAIGHLRLKMYRNGYTRRLMRRHIKEQYRERLRLADIECISGLSCKMCGCETPAMFFSKKGCEGKCYGEMLDKDGWEIKKRKDRKESRRRREKARKARRKEEYRRNKSENKKDN